jgi:hypothetical protein
MGIDTCNSMKLRIGNERIGSCPQRRWNQTQVSGIENIEYCQGKIILKRLNF